MDRLFGTYVCPAHEPEQFGIHEAFPATYLGQPAAPLLPKRFRKQPGAGHNKPTGPTVFANQTAASQPVDEGVRSDNP